MSNTAARAIPFPYLRRADTSSESLRPRRTVSDSDTGVIGGALRLGDAPESSPPHTSLHAPDFSLNRAPRRRRRRRRRRRSCTRNSGPMTRSALASGPALPVRPSPSESVRVRPSPSESRHGSPPRPGVDGLRTVCVCRGGVIGAGGVWRLARYTARADDG